MDNSAESLLIFPHSMEEFLAVLRNAFLLVSPPSVSFCVPEGRFLTSVCQGFFYVLILIVYNMYFHPLCSYPGPRLCAATRIPYFRSLLGGCLVSQVAKWHEKYGPVVRIAPDELSYTSAAAWKDIYGYRRNSVHKPKDTRFYSAPIADTSDTNLSKKAVPSCYRGSLAQAFSDFSLRQQEPVIKGYVDILISKLHQQTETETRSIDMVSWYSFTTFDIIRDLAFGESFDCLKNAHYHEWISMIFNKIRVGVYLNVIKRIPGGKGLMRFLVARFVPSRIKHQVLTAEGIENHFNGGDGKPTFLGHFLKQEDPSKQLTIPEILSDASAFILAGSETTATALCGITYYLLKERACMKKLVQEIRDSFDTEDEITFASVSKLKYILAVVNEGLRMYPPVPIGLPRIVQGEGAIIDGKWVPGKVR